MKLQKILIFFTLAVCFVVYQNFSSTGEKGLEIPERPAGYGEKSKSWLSNDLSPSGSGRDLTHKVIQRQGEQFLREKYDWRVKKALSQVDSVFKTEISLNGKSSQLSSDPNYRESGDIVSVNLLNHRGKMQVRYDGTVGLHCEYGLSEQNLQLKMDHYLSSVGTTLQLEHHTKSEESSMSMKWDW